MTLYTRFDLQKYPRQFSAAKVLSFNKSCNYTFGLKLLNAWVLNKKQNRDYIDIFYKITYNKLSSSIL